MKYFGWVFLFFVIVYILPLGSRPLVTPEYKFAESAREMVLSGDYVTPRLRGETTTFNPAPAYYPAAKSIQLFGKNGFAVRFPSALAAGLTALFIWILIAQMLRDEKLAALSAIIYLTSSGIYASGTVATPGALFAMLCTGSCGCLFIALQEAKLNRRKILNLLLAGIFSGFGLLAGGFCALLIPLLSGLTYMIWDKKLRQLPVILISVLAISALIALPWLLAINRAEPEFLCAFVRQEFASFCSRRNSMPWYWPLYFFALGSFPSALLIPAAGVVGKDAWKGFLRQPLFRFAFCFLFIPLTIAMLNPAWDINVVLCSFAPLALLIAAGIRVYFNSGGHHRSYNWLMTAWGILLAAGGVGLVVLHFTKPEYLKELPITELFYPVMGTVLIVSGAMMVYSAIGNWRSRLYLYFAGIGLVLLFMPWFFKSNVMMPGEALRALGSRCPLNSSRHTIVAANHGIANAAAWEFDFTDVRTPDKLTSGKKPVTTPKILFISNQFNSGAIAPAIEKKRDYLLNVQEINADPLQMMIFDLTASPEKP